MKHPISSARRRVRALGELLCLTALVVPACYGVAQCGDGLLDPGEGCDDGNAKSGDGCSATCQPDDDRRTAGDDRADYVTCEQKNACGTQLTCGPGLGCCESDQACASDGEGCSTPFQFTTCDGPEDCPQGEQCWVEAHGIACASSSPYFDVRCHTDADCVEPDRNPCVAGTCIGDALNVPPAVAAAP